MNNLINRKTFYEMFRYVIVGGISAVVDIAGLTFFVEVIFNSEKTPVNMVLQILVLLLALGLLFWELQ